MFELYVEATDSTTDNLLFTRSILTCVDLIWNYLQNLYLNT
jgi:hypothetical protein